MSADQQINYLLHQLALQDYVHNMVLEVPQHRNSNANYQEDISDWSSALAPSYHQHSPSVKAHSRSKSDFRERIDRLSLPRITNSIASFREDQPEDLCLNSLTRRQSLEEQLVNKGPIKSYEETILSKRTNLAILQGKKQPLPVVKKKGAYSIEKHKAMRSHLRQPDPDRLIQRLEKGIDVVEQLNRLRTRSILDADVEKGSSIVVNHALLQGKTSLRLRKRLQIVYQNPESWIAEAK